jgi:glycosyltransferase involved in cell wall biosynthesis
MRVLHVYSGNLFGGVERILTAYAAHGGTEHCEIEFALCFDGRLRETLRDAGAVQHDLGPVRARYPWSRSRARARLRGLLEARHFDVVVVHSAWSQAMFASVVRERSVPLAFYLHDVANGTHWLERWASRHQPDLVITNSQFTARSTAKLYPGARIAALYAPVDVKPRLIGAGERSAMRASLDTRDDEVVVIQVSRMQAWKGHALLLDALARLRATYPSAAPRWKLWIVGGPQRDEERQYVGALRAHARDLGIEDSIRFLGERRDVPELLASADVFCQPNVGPEPFGIVFIEALAAGLPVIATRMGGALEIVDDSCGLLVLPTAVELAGALGQVLEDDVLRRTLGAAGPVRAQALCNPQRQWRALVQVLRALPVHPATLR